MSSVFEFQDYREYIRHRIASSECAWGYQGRLAEAARCQPSFLSQALKGRVQLTIDHVAGLADFWHLTEDERSYLLHLLMEERAAHPALRAHCRKVLEDLRAQHGDLSRRLNYPSLVRPEHEAIYYSSWLYPAIHIGTSIPALRSIQRISEYFGINPRHATEILGTLTDMGLVERQGADEWVLTGRFLHLRKDSPFFPTHHINWRFRCGDHLQKRPGEGMHYTSVVSLSKRDIPRIEEEIRQFVERVHAIVADSREENLMGFSCDFFEVTR